MTSVAQVMPGRGSFAGPIADLEVVPSIGGYGGEQSMQTLVAEILAAWRRAERLAESLEPGSPERMVVDRACERLRDAYSDLTESGVAHVLTAREARELIAHVDLERDLTS